MAIELTKALSLWKGVPRNAHTDTVIKILQNLMPDKLPLVTDFEGDLRALDNMGTMLEVELQKVKKDIAAAAKNPALLKTLTKAQDCLKQIIEAVNHQVMLIQKLRQNMLDNLNEVFVAAQDFLKRPARERRQNIWAFMMLCVSSNMVGNAKYKVKPSSLQILQKLVMCADAILEAMGDLAKAEKSSQTGAIEKAKKALQGATQEMTSALRFRAGVVAI